MISSRITQKYQTTIPTEVRKALNLHSGDSLCFELRGNQVFIRKATLLDLEFASALQQTLNEWNSQEDENLYANL
jgi:AbrB family looped-hinge helix DNA binding protein